ncbi:MAG TPA: hypothetical protein VHM00_17625 [Caldimonas sp.]|jgi:hypothetical protein|nr:hypothetical protein [Caldimonas sp.]HEX2542888.1 hypothetical protein [Caldimonas sp.]
MGLLQALGLTAPSVAAANTAPPTGGGEGPLDVKADVGAVLQEVLDLVLGGISDDDARKAVNAEYLKLKTAFDKADKLGSTKAKVAAWQAILAPAQALRTRADGIRYAFGLWDGNGKALVAPARAAIGKVGGAAKAVLETTLSGLEADAIRAARAGDSTALQSTVQPKLVKLHELATTLPKRSTEIDAGIAAAAKVLLALDKARASELLVRLAALQNAKASGWPAGATLDEVAASLDGLLAEARALQTEGRALATGLQDERELAIVRKRLDELKARIARADDTPVPPYIELRQSNVRNFAKTIEEQMAAKNKAAVLKTLGLLTLSLGDMEGMKDRHAEYRRKFEAARDGAVKKARALKLKPADFAASRDKQLQDRENEIEASTGKGVFDPALRQIDIWVRQADAWGQAQAAYDNLHSKSPDVGKLEDLARLPGGDKVLDQLVADLPPTTTPKVLYAALKARYGVEITQYSNMKKDKDGKPSWDIDTSTKLDPTKPDPDQEVDLEGLYSVLGKVPNQDVQYVEKIKRVTKDKVAAIYDGGILNDTIELHCGRPGSLQAETTDFNAPGEVVPPGESVQAGCEPPAGAADAPWFDFTVLHEVGHAVDDARNIMGGDRGKDAGWSTPGTGTIAEKIAATVGYDKKYIENMLDDKASSPPKKVPKPPEGTKQADWDKARAEAEAWVRDIRVGKKPWGNAAVAKKRATADGMVYHEGYEGYWVGYRYSARAQGITGYQFRAPAEWFAELYAAYHMQKLNPAHPASKWLATLKAQSQTS